VRGNLRCDKAPHPDPLPASGERETTRLGLPLRHPAVIVASFFGAGLLPAVPGSWGSLAALPLAWAIAALSGTIGLAVATAGLFGLGWWAAAIVTAEGGLEDPGWIVVDEAVGQWLVLLAAPRSLFAWAAAFVLFRLFDIVKPWPIGWADRHVRGGLGIMLDDLLAAVYAAAILLAIGWVAGVRP